MSYYNSINSFIDDMTNIKDVCLIIVVNNEDEQVLIQEMKRVINNKEITFISLRNVYLKEENRNKGYFKKIVSFLESFNKPVMIHDVVSNVVEQYCRKREWKEFIDNKNGNKLLCFYKI